MEWIKQQPLDIIIKIMDNCDTISQIYLTSTCKKFNGIFYEYDLSDKFLMFPCKGQRLFH